MNKNVNYDILKDENIICNIFHFLSSKQINELKYINKLFKKIIENDIICKQLIKNDFNIDIKNDYYTKIYNKIYKKIKISKKLCKLKTYIKMLNDIDKLECYKNIEHSIKKFAKNKIKTFLYKLVCNRNFDIFNVLVYEYTDKFLCYDIVKIFLLSTHSILCNLSNEEKIFISKYKKDSKIFDIV